MIPCILSDLTSHKFSCFKRHFKRFKKKIIYFSCCSSKTKILILKSLCIFLAVAEYLRRSSQSRGQILCHQKDKTRKYMLYRNVISLKANLEDTQGARHNPKTLTFSKEEDAGRLKGHEKSKVYEHFGMDLPEWELPGLIAA